MKTQTMPLPRKSGASGTLRHPTPVLVRHPSLIERIYAKLSLRFMFSMMGIAAVASWFVG